VFTVAQTRARGATALHNALYVALKQFGRTAHEEGPIRRQAVAVLSDGEDTSSLITFDDVMALARKSGVTVYAIGLRSKYTGTTATAGRRYFSEAEYSLKTLAQETGGQAYFPPDVGALDGIYGSIAHELASQYSLGYAPTNTRPDGRFRRIVVQILSRPELRPKARSGYTADDPGAAAGGGIRP
jgi:VWFA-related protein